MNLEDLRAYRRRAPGVLIVLGSLPLVAYFTEIDPRKNLADSTVAVVAALFCSHLYTALRIRNKVWRSELDANVGAQIEESILSLAPADLNMSKSEETFVRSNVRRRTTGIFWQAVDRDDRMRDKKSFFYENGQDYTTAVDLFLIAGFYVPVSGVFFLATQNTRFLWCVGVYAAIALFAVFVLLPAARREHIKLSREQLAEVKQFQVTFVSERIVQLVDQYRKSQR